MTINRDAAEAIAANLKRYVDLVDTFTEAVRIASAQHPEQNIPNPEPEPASMCVHGATAEELCNKLPSDAELAELRTADGERGIYQGDARREKARADAAETQLQHVWEQVGYPDPDERPYNMTAAGAVAYHVGYIEARLSRVNGPAVSELLSKPMHMEELVQAVVQLAHDPLTLPDDITAIGVSSRVSPTLNPADVPETPALRTAQDADDAPDGDD